MTAGCAEAKASAFIAARPLACRPPRSTRTVRGGESLRLHCGPSPSSRPGLPSSARRRKPPPSLRRDRTVEGYESEVEVCAEAKASAFIAARALPVNLVEVFTAAFVRGGESLRLHCGLNRGGKGGYGGVVRGARRRKPPPSLRPQHDVAVLRPS